MKFPSREWCEAAAAAVQQDPGVVAAEREFGPVVAGIVIERGGALLADFCVLARIAPGKPATLSFPEDEDELEALEPDYLAHVSYALCKELLQAAQAGGKPDPLRAIIDRRVRLKGDLQRLVKHAGKHQGAGLEALRNIPTTFL